MAEDVYKRQKLATVRENHDYYTPIVPEDSYLYHVYDTLDVVYENRLKIMQRMNSAIRKGMGRDTSLLFYDVTNFYFEIGDPDPDEEDGNGETVETVSYTHLDVYKRQDLGMLIISHDDALLQKVCTRIETLPQVSMH